MEQIQTFLGVGHIYPRPDKAKSQFRIQSIKDLAKIMDHFDRYPLITQKLADYFLKQPILGF